MPVAAPLASFQNRYLEDYTSLLGSIVKYIVEIPKSVTTLLDHAYESFRTSEVFHYIPEYLIDTVVSLFDLAVDSAVTQAVGGDKSWDSYEELACSIATDAETLFTALQDSLGRLRVNKLIATFTDYIGDNDEAFERFPLAVSNQFESMSTRRDTRFERKVNILLAISMALSYEIASRFRDEDVLERIRTELPSADIPSDFEYKIRLRHHRRAVVLEVA